MNSLKLVGIGLCGVMVGCSEEETAPPGPGPETATAIRGWVTDGEREPIAGVRVASALGDTQTDASGRFELTGAISGDVVVSFSKEGYVTRFDKTRLVADQVTARHAVLMAETAPQPLDASTGGNISGPRGVEVAVPPGAFVDADGVPVTGMVDVSLTPFDPSVTEEAMAVGGDMLGQDMAGDPSLLESFGMLDITVRQGGEELQVASGQSLDVAIAVPTAVGAPEATTGLWSYDEASAAWVQEGTMTYDEASGTYRATIGHMSMWNADKAAERSCVCGRVVDPAGAPVPGVLMSVAGVDYLGVTVSLSEAPDGKFCSVVRRDSQATVGPYPFALGSAERIVDTGAADTEVPPQNGGEHCVDIGEWTLDRDAYFPPGSDGSSSGCELLDNPLEGTCVEDLVELTECWQPEGACSMESNGTAGYDIVYGNGARFESTSTMPGDLGGNYIAQDGTLCGSFELVDESGTIRLSLPDGRSWEMSQDQETGATTYRCEDGTEVVLTAQEGAALQACYSTDTEQCTLTGTGEMGQPCVGPDECNDGLTCCDLGQSSMMCLDATTCEMISP